MHTGSATSLNMVMVNVIFKRHDLGGKVFCLRRIEAEESILGS